METEKIEEIVSQYTNGSSLREISKRMNVPISTARHWIKKSGSLRTREDGIAIACLKGKFSKQKGLKRTFSKSHIENIRIAAKNRKSKGFSLKPTGYLEYTTGENKFRGVHVVIMEKMIGRKLYSNECVHHIDGNKTNNAKSNLALMTRSEHARLHALENYSKRKRENGRFA